MALVVVKTIEEVRHAVAEARRSGQPVALVPTMGALHPGHISLFRAARQEAGFVVVSIFINPTQFGSQEDLTHYPRQLERDVEICSREAADLVFAPDETTVYPPGFRTFVEVAELGDVLCGPSRPGHFRGVATVVLKLFHMVEPDIAYFGQKDAQQARIIQQMVTDLNLTVRLRICPIVREPDGLALSSRNQHLSPGQRRQATVLHQALEEARRRIEAGARNAADSVKDWPRESGAPRSVPGLCGAAGCRELDTPGPSPGRRLDSRGRQVRQHATYRQHPGSRCRVGAGPTCAIGKVGHLPAGFSRPRVFLPGR